MSWEKVFYQSVGTYVQFINNRLAAKYDLEPLSKHIKIVGGFAFKSSQYKKQGIPVIRISNFNSEKIDLSDTVFYEPSTELQRYELTAGDIIIALTGGTIGKLAIVQPDLGTIYLNQRVGKFEIQNSSVFEQEYVYWIARSVQNTVKNLAWGGAQPNVSPKQIENLEFPIPSKEVQKGIVKFLNRLKSDESIQTEYFDKEIEKSIFDLQIRQVATDRVVSELSDQLEMVSQLRQAFLREAMQGKLVPQDETDEPAEVLLKKIKAEKAKLVAEKTIKKEKPLRTIKREEIPFENPLGWTCCRLIEISDVGTGATPLTSNREFYENGDIPWITSSATNSLFIDNANSFITQKALRETNCKIYPSGTLVIAMYGQGKTRGQISEMNINAATNQACATISPYLDDLEFKRFIKLFFQKIYLEIRELAQGGAQPNLNMLKIKNTVLPIPPLAEQKRIVEKLEKLMAFCDKLEANIRESKHYAETLLQVSLKEALEPNSRVSAQRNT